MEKRILFVVLLFGFLFGGCNNDDDLEFTNEVKAKLDLTAPNGQKIAESVESLSAIIDVIAEQYYGENKDVKISKIGYYDDVDDGYMAEVTYVTFDGYSNKVIITNISFSGEANLLKIKTRAEHGTDGYQIIYSCKNSNRKKCPDCEIFIDSAGKARCNCSKGDRKYCELKTEKVQI